MSKIHPSTDDDDHGWFYCPKTHYHCESFALLPVSMELLPFQVATVLVCTSNSFSSDFRLPPHFLLVWEQSLPLSLLQRGAKSPAGSTHSFIAHLTSVVYGCAVAFSFSSLVCSVLPKSLFRHIRGNRIFFSPFFLLSFWVWLFARTLSHHF